MKIDNELLDIEGIKKSNKPLLDLFIRRTAVLTSTNEKLVEKIVKDQWQQANKKTQPGSKVAEIDFCNLGTFFISKNKANKKLLKIDKIQKAIEAKYNSDTPEDQKKRELFTSRNNNMIKNIKTKLKTDQEDEN